MVAIVLDPIIVFSQILNTSELFVLVLLVLDRAEHPMVHKETWPNTAALRNC